MKTISIKKIISNKWFVLLFNAMFFALMAWLLPIHFEENDDATMCMIANGHYSGTPDGHLVFINAIYGWVIAGLYMIADIVEWYTLSFCILHVLAMTVIMYVLINKMKLPIWLKMVFIVFAYVFWIRIIIAFQFTTTAGLLCFSGCLSLLQSFQNQNSLSEGRLSRNWRLFGLFAIFVASLIRFHTAALVGLLCLPMFVEAITHNRRYVLWLVGVLVVVLCGKYADGLFYQSPDWAYYRDYNSVRGTINDNPYADLNIEELPSGVSELDYELFRNFAGDSKVMTLDRIKTIQSEIREDLSVKRCLVNIKYLRLYLFPVLFVGVGLLVCLVLEKNRRLYPLLALLVFFVTLIYLGAFHDLKYRVFLCMLLPMMYQILYWCSSVSNDNRLDIVSHIVVTIACFGVCVKYVKQDVGFVIHVNAWNKETVEKYLWPLLKGKEERTLCTYSGWAYTEYIHPFKLHNLPVRFMGFGWMTANPLNKGVLECHLDLVDSNVLCGCYVYDCPDRLFETSEKLVKAIKKNYDVAADVVVVDSNKKFVLYRLVSN